MPEPTRRPHGAGTHERVRARVEHLGSSSDVEDPEPFADVAHDVRTAELARSLTAPADGPDEPATRIEHTDDWFAPVERDDAAIRKDCEILDAGEQHPGN